MMDWTRRRPAASAQVLTGLGSEFGVPVGVSLRGTGLSPGMLTDPHTQVSGIQDLQIATNLVAALPRVEHLGLLAGVRYHTTTHGTLGFAALTAPTALEGLEVMGRYLPLSFALCHQVQHWEGEEYVITFDAEHLPEQMRPFYYQRELASLVAQARDVAGPGVADAAPPITFRQAPPRSPEAHRAFADLAQGEPTFGAAQTEVRLAAELVHRPLPYANAMTHAQMLAEAEKDYQDLLADSSLVGQVRALVERHLGQGAPVDLVARDLRMSPRTLRRQLQVLDTSYRAVLEDVRDARAIDLLTHPTMTVAQIASRLGYENPPAFTAAFRRRRGITPTEHRRSQ